MEITCKRIKPHSRVLVDKVTGKKVKKTGKIVFLGLQCTMQEYRDICFPASGNIAIIEEYKTDFYISLVLFIVKKKIDSYVTESTADSMKGMNDEQLTQINNFITELFKPQRKPKVPVTIRIFDDDKITQDIGYEGMGVKKERKKK